MSKNLTIDEGSESRRFDGVRRLKTKLMGEDAGTCYWVPDDETQARPTFIIDNGMHVAEEEGVYGFSEANVNVFIPTPNPEWDIRIDDIDIPHIHIEDIDINIDDNDIHIDDIDITIDDIDGTPIIDIDGVDIDGVDIDSIDIRIDPDIGIPIPHIEIPEIKIHIWTDPEDIDKIHIKEEPDGEEIILDIDDIDPDPVNIKDLIDIDYDDEEDKWVITASDKIKVDDVDYEVGDVIKSWDKDEIVDLIMEIEKEYTIDYPDIDPDFGDDFDIELDLDNMELDMDGMDMDIDLPLLKMPDMDDKLPDEIRIMHVPNKTSYKDGEAIDLDGIVVQAYKNGEVWQNNKYINGYIPVHELSVNPASANIELSKEMADIPEYMQVSTIAETASVDAITNVLTHNFPDDIEDEARQEAVTNAPESIRGAFSGAISDAGGGFAFYSWGGTPTFGPGTEWSPGAFWGIQILTEDLGNGQYRYAEYTWAYIWYGWGDNIGLHLFRGGPKYGTISLYQGEDANEHISNVNAPTKRVMKCEVTWHRPIDGMALSDSFEIAVEDTTPTGN